MNNYKYLIKSFAVLFLTGLVFPNIAFAHVRWALGSVTPPRTNSTGLKSEPCGGALKTTRSTIFSGGQTIDVEFEETIEHPGHFRIAFSPAGDLNFDDYVLADNIPDNPASGFYKQNITIPVEICDACSLQLIQVMTTSPTPGPGDFYYSCTDIQITNPGDITPPDSVSNVVPVAGDGQASISWTNPTADFYRVVVLKSTNNVMGVPTNGVNYNVGDMIDGSEVVYMGNASEFVATSLTNDNDYYFKVFSQNPRKNYASGVEAMVTPTSSASNGGGVGTAGDAPPPSDIVSGSIHPGWFLLMLVASRLFRKRLPPV